MAQMVCGSCRRLLSYPRGTKHVKCSCCQTVNLFLEADYKNEVEVGEALTEALKTGLVKREDLFITTKELECNGSQRLEEALQRQSVLAHFLKGFSCRVTCTFNTPDIKGVTPDLKVKPLKELTFNSRNITASMTSPIHDCIYSQASERQLKLSGEEDDEPLPPYLPQPTAFPPLPSTQNPSLRILDRFDQKLTDVRPYPTQI